MNRQKISLILIDIFAVFGIVFFLILIHELVHVIDGYGPNVALCIGLTNINRVSFVVNGENYSLFTEPIAYGVTIIAAALIFLLISKAGGEK